MIIKNHYFARNITGILQLKSYKVAHFNEYWYILDLVHTYYIIMPPFSMRPVNGLIKVDLEFSFSIPGLFQTWKSNKPGFENLNSRSAPGFEKLNSRSELELSKIAIIK